MNERESENVLKHKLHIWIHGNIAYLIILLAWKWWQQQWKECWKKIEAHQNYNIRITSHEFRYDQIARFYSWAREKPNVNLSIVICCFIFYIQLKSNGKISFKSVCAQKNMFMMRFSSLCWMLISMWIANLLHSIEIGFKMENLFTLNAQSHC